LTDQGPDVPRRHHRPPPVLTRLLRTAGVFAVLVGGLLVGGFFLFLSTIPQNEPPSRVAGDGIVALTGGPERVQAGLNLLAEGRARRLLISGVNPDTSAAQLAKLHPESARWLQCCTDLGRRALNTAGNAVETRQWVRRNGFDTVIVVTSGWHMQRSLLELQRAIPETVLVPYPVDARNGTDDVWWSQPGNFRLLVAEYIKYLAALIEVRIAPPTGDAPSQKQKS